MMEASKRKEKRKRIMKLPQSDKLMLPILKLCADGEIAKKILEDKLANYFDLTSEQRAEAYPKIGEKVFAKRVGWVKSELKHAGLLYYPRRTYANITAEGRKLLELKLDSIDRKYLIENCDNDLYRKFRGKDTKEDTPEPSFEAGSDDGAEASLNGGDIPYENLQRAHNSLERALALELVERILRSPPQFFEKMIVKLLLAMGYGGLGQDPVRKLGQSSDGGVDGVIDQDPLGTDQIYIQAKRYGTDNKIGLGAIRDFFGAITQRKAQKGLFITTSSFSKSAQETAKLLDKRIVLIDGDRLANLMIHYNVGCRVVDTLHLREVDEVFFEDD